MRRAPLLAHHEDVREDVAESTRPVILFDGECHLCNGFVQFVLPRDPAGYFAFAPLQSEFARQRLGAVHLDSIGLAENGEVVYAEIALLRILSRLNRPWPWLAQMTGRLPGPLLAWGYRFVARHRYRLFGRDEICALRQPAWKDRFLS
jgi:predicted DCC family thiol-disulfide oxidoreductase YuxK